MHFGGIIRGVYKLDKNTSNLYSLIMCQTIKNIIIIMENISVKNCENIISSLLAMARRTVHGRRVEHPSVLEGFLHRESPSGIGILRRSGFDLSDVCMQEAGDRHGTHLRTERFPDDEGVRQRQESLQSLLL